MGMSVLIDKSGDVYYDGTHNVSLMEVFVDSASDLTGLVSVESIYFQLGSKATDVSTGDVYRCDSNGAWHLQPSESIQLDLTGYYTSAQTDALLAGKQDSLSASQMNAVNSGITSSEVSALPDFVDIGAKNMIKFYETATAGGGNAAINSNGYSVTLSGTSSVTGMRMADIVGLENETYIFKYDTTGTTGSALVIYDNTSSSVFRALTPGSGEVEISNFVPSHYYSLNNYVGSATTLNGTVSAMLCKKSLYAISDKYVPYRPTIYDIYNV